MLLTPERSEELKARIQAAVEQALQDRELSARRASLDVVGNDGLIRDIRAGRMPGVDRLEALCEYLGLEFYLGPRRARPAAPAFAEPAAQASDLGSREALRAGYLPIPWHPQAPRPSGQPVPPVAFARAWLDAAGLDPARLAAVQPDPEPGVAEAIVLVDTMAPRKGGPALWCYREGGRALVGRIQFETDVTLILGAAPQDPARAVVGADRAAVLIYGRVVWSGRREGATASPTNA